MEYRWEFVGFGESVIRRLAFLKDMAISRKFNDALNSCKWNLILYFKLSLVFNYQQIKGNYWTLFVLSPNKGKCFNKWKPKNRDTPIMQ